MTFAKAFFAPKRLLGLLACLCVGGCVMLTCGCGSKDSANDAKSGDRADKAGPAKELTSAEEVLQAMTEAYRNAKSYSDTGTIRMVVDAVDEKGRLDQKFKFAVSFERSNKLRIDAYRTTVVVADGRFLATIDDPVFKEQFVDREAPQRMTVPTLLADDLVVRGLSAGPGGLPPQLPMLLDDDALPLVLGQSDQPTLVEPGEIGGRACYRVKARRPDGTAVFWVDKRDFALRRFEYPIDEWYRLVSQQGPARSVSLTADFDGATFDKASPPSTWAFQPKNGAIAGKFFIPPDARQLLAKRAPKFNFVDLQGKELSSDALAGKIVVLCGFVSQPGPCRQILPMFEKLHQAYVGSDVVCLAVSVDAPSLENESIADFCKKVNLTAPVVRDAKSQLPDLFRTYDVPCTIVIDAKGILQDVGFGPNPELAGKMAEKIEALRAGKNVYDKPIEQYQTALRDHEKEIDLRVAGVEPKKDTNESEPIPKTNLAPASEPQRLKLAPQWTSRDVKNPGNLLILSNREGATIAVVDGAKGIAELDLAGKLVARHRLLPDDSPEVINMLRVATDAKGKRYLAAFAVTQQRFHLIDENWKIVFSYPADALENNHSGIADVQFADLDGDGAPEIYVGYFETVGIQAVSLDGRRTAANRTVTNVLHMAVTGPSQGGARALYCVNSSGSLVAFGPKLERLGEVVVRNRGISWITSAELTGNPQPQFCGLNTPLGGVVAIGLDAGGQELWTYTLPEGVHHQPIEPAVPGRVAGNMGQWILPGCDGSIAFVSPDNGQVVDRFNYGKTLAGVATVDVDGKPTLIVASPGSIEALRVE